MRTWITFTIALLTTVGCASGSAQITPIDLDAAATGTAAALTAWAPPTSPASSEMADTPPAVQATHEPTPTPAPTIAPHELIPHPAGRTLRDIEFVSANDGWAVGDGATILHFINGRWIPFPAPDAGGNTVFHSVEMLNAAEGWIVGEADGSGVIFRYLNGVWRPFEVPPGVGPLLVVRFGPDGSGWAGGQTHLLRYTPDGWYPVTEASIHDMDFTGSGIGWAVGEHGLVGRYENGIWMDAPRPGDVPLTAVDFVTADEGWAVAATETGAIYHYVSGSWEEQPKPGLGPLYAILMAGPELGWAAGSTPDGRGFVLRYRDGTWETLLLAGFPDELPRTLALEMVAPGRLWAVGEGVGVTDVLVFDGE